jgi:tetratricopeptide (TPR) repeat protein
MSNKKISSFILLFLFLSTKVLSQDFSAGLKLIQNEKYNQAKKYFIPYLKGETRKDAYFYLGEINFLLEKYDSAKINYSKGIDADKEYPLNYAGLAKVNIVEKKTSEANKNQEQAIELGDETNAQVFVVLADGYSKVKNYDKAIELLNQALKINSKYVPAYNALGNIYLARGNGTDAIKNFQKAIDIDPSNPDAMTRKAKVYILINNFNEAISLLNEAVQSNPDYAPAYYELAELNYSLRDYAKAADYYSKYMASSESTLDKRRRYASILYLNKEYQKSIDILKDVIKAEPGNPVAVRMLAYSYLRLDDVEKSKSYFQTLFGMSSVEYLPSDYENYADLLLRTGNDSLAVVYMYKIYEIDSTRKDVLSKISVTCFQNRDWNCVVSALEKKGGLTAQEYFDLGKAYYFKGDASISKLTQSLVGQIDLEENQPPEIRSALMHYQKDISGTNEADKVQAQKKFNDKMETILKKPAQKRAWASIKAQWWAEATTSISNDYTKADTAFAMLSSKAPDLPIAYFWRARVKANFDPESELGLAKPYYEKFLTVSNADTDKFKKEIIEAYKYLGYYYFLKNDKQQSLEYWRKVLNLDPADTQAEDAIKGITAENKKPQQ